MPPFNLDDLINTYAYTKDEVDELLELNLPHETSEDEIIDNINDFFSSAQKQLETLYAQNIISKLLPKNIKMFFAGMYIDTDTAGDIFVKAKALYDIVMKLNNRTIKLMTIYKYMRLVKAAMIMED